MADDARLGQRAHHGSQVADRERIHERDTVLEEELHDHEVRRVRPLGVELGIDADPWRGGDPLAQRRERGLCVDDRDGRLLDGHERTDGRGASGGGETRR